MLMLFSDVLVNSVDTLVFHIQFIHDGHLSRWPGEHDTHENTSQGLRSVQQRRRY